MNETASRKITALNNAIQRKYSGKSPAAALTLRKGYAQRLRNLERLFGNRNDLYKVVWTNLIQTPPIPNLKSEETLKEFVRVFDEFRNHAALLDFAYDDRLVYNQLSVKFSRGIILSFQKDCTTFGREYTASNLRDWVEEARLNVRSLMHTDETAKARKSLPVSTFGKVLLTTSQKEPCAFVRRQSS